MLRRFCHAPVGRPCRSRLTPVIVLPRIAPIIRMAYLGLNQGSSRTCFVSANTATRIARSSSPWCQVRIPRCRRIDDLSAPMLPARKHDYDEHRHTGPEWRCQGEEALRTGPINRGYTTIRRAAISNLRSRRRRSHLNRAAPSTTNRRQSPNSRRRERWACSKRANFGFACVQSEDLTRKALRLRDVIRDH